MQLFFKVDLYKTNSVAWIQIYLDIAHYSLQCIWFRIPTYIQADTGEYTPNTDRKMALNHISNAISRFVLNRIAYS